MPRDIPVGNGNVLVAFDKDYNLRELYFPHVGEENHTKGEPFRFGVWANGRFSWVPDGWRISRDYLDDTLITRVLLADDRSMLRIEANDLVDFNENIFMKRLTVENSSGEDREVRFFFCHDFHIRGLDIGDTAAFRPDAGGMLHYKGDRYFLINAYANKKSGFDAYAAGNKESGSREGTWRDAEDGALSGNPVAQGSVDSVTALHFRLKPGEKETCYYWMCIGKNWEEVSVLNALVLKKRPEAIFKRTADYWKLWVDKEDLNYNLLPDEVVRLYKRSLLICRTQIDSSGSIIAANDSDVVYFNRDTYSYMWPRDAALVSYALDLAGYSGVTRNFFNLCAELIAKEGYLFHKYTPSGALASSWHPWQKDNKPQLPIQEDETALVIWALWRHYQLVKDIEFIRPLYKPLIKRAADFMMNYRDLKTGLPLPSHDLWEERHGVLTFTVAAVHGGLSAAARFAAAFGETDLAREYADGARRIREGMDRYLYLQKERRFARMLVFRSDGSAEVDATIDASLYGVFAFGAYAPDDERVRETMRQVRERLWCPGAVGGLARYENDSYYRDDSARIGNPWFVTTLWLAQYHVAAARTRADLAPAEELMLWAARRALPSGVLAEQVHPVTNQPLSVSPLTWSHGTFIAVVREYLNKLLAIERCPACGQSKYTLHKRENGNES